MHWGVLPCGECCRALGSVAEHCGYCLGVLPSIGECCRALGVLPRSVAVNWECCREFGVLSCIGDCCRTLRSVAEHWGVLPGSVAVH